MKITKELLYKKTFWLQLEKKANSKVLKREIRNKEHEFLKRLAGKEATNMKRQGHVQIIKCRTLAGKLISGAPSQAKFRSQVSPPGP